MASLSVCSAVFNDYLFNACYVLMALLEGMVLNNTLANGNPSIKILIYFLDQRCPPVVE